MTQIEGGGVTLTNDELLEFQKSATEYLRADDIKAKYNVEFGRFKQDCRKRALDLAVSDAHTPKLNSEGNNVVEKIDILKLAAEYYNWLISIPE